MSRRLPWPWSYLWVPTLMIAGAVGFEMLTPPQYFASPLLVAACVVAGALLGLAGTLVVVVAA